MVTIKNSQYIIEDARKKRKLIKFVLVIIRTIKTTNMLVYNQIILIYTGIELEFRRDLFKPTEEITMDSCFQELENNIKNWWGITTIRIFFNYPPVNYQSNRTVGNNPRPNGQSSSYNLIFGKRQNGFGYGIPVVVTGITGYNQLPRPIQYFIFYQFQKRVYPFQQQPRFFFRLSNKFY